MKLFERRPKSQLPTEEEAAKLERRIAEIKAEVNNENFVTASEMAVKCAEDYRGKNTFGEACCSYLVGHSLICQHLKNISPADQTKAEMSSADYNRAKKYLTRSSEIYDFFSRNKKFERNRRLKCAIVLIDLAMLESFVAKWDEAVEVCARSLDICKEYEFKEGATLATRLMFNLKTQKLFLDIKDFVGMQ